MWSQSDENRQTQLKSVLWKHKKKSIIARVSSSPEGTVLCCSKMWEEKEEGM